MGPWKVTNTLFWGSTTILPCLDARPVIGELQLQTLKCSTCGLPTVVHAFEDKFAYLVWEADLGISEMSTVALFTKTLTDREAVRDKAVYWG